MHIVSINKWMTVEKKETPHFGVFKYAYPFYHVHSSSRSKFITFCDSKIVRAEKWKCRQKDQLQLATDTQIPNNVLINFS